MGIIDLFHALDATAHGCGDVGAGISVRDGEDIEVIDALVFGFNVLEAI